MEINCKIVVTALNLRFAFCLVCTVLPVILPAVESLLSPFESRKPFRRLLFFLPGDRMVASSKEVINNETNQIEKPVSSQLHQG